MPSDFTAIRCRKAMFGCASYHQHCRTGTGSLLPNKNLQKDKEKPKKATLKSVQIFFGLVCHPVISQSYMNFVNSHHPHVMELLCSPLKGGQVTAANHSKNHDKRFKINSSQQKRNEMHFLTAAHSCSNRSQQVAHGHKNRKCQNSVQAKGGTRPPAQTALARP